MLRQKTRRKDYEMLDYTDFILQIVLDAQWTDIRQFHGKLKKIASEGLSVAK